MSYKLEKPYTDIEKSDFICKYHLDTHNEGYNCHIEETETALFALEENEILVDGEPQVDPDYEEKEKQKRKENFESHFIETSMKDSQGNNSYYRQVPQGYANAPQTIELADKYVRDAQGMTEQIAELLIFYQKPDFTKAEECTEEWLIAHQFHPPVNMTLQEWKAFEFDFQLRWSALKYKTANGENTVEELRALK